MIRLLGTRSGGKRIINSLTKKTGLRLKSFRHFLDADGNAQAMPNKEVESPEAGEWELVCVRLTQDPVM